MNIYIFVYMYIYICIFVSRRHELEPFMPESRSLQAGSLFDFSNRFRTLFVGFSYWDFIFISATFGPKTGFNHLAGTF